MCVVIHTLTQRSKYTLDSTISSQCKVQSVNFIRIKMYLSHYMPQLITQSVLSSSICSIPIVVVRSKLLRFLKKNFCVQLICGI